VCCACAYSQSVISGIINEYTKVTQQLVCDSAIVVADPALYRVGDRVLLVQMKGAVVSRENNGTYGTIQDIASAGLYEFLNIQSIIGSTITFTTRFVHRYQTAEPVQLVRVPVFGSVEVVGKLTPRGWNGVVGGVVAFEVRDTLFLRSDVDASGLGFRGGRVSTSVDGCEINNWVSNYLNGRGGEKGEAIVAVPPLQPIASHGALANGGGGGNGTNAGGAGGGNGGKGGNGGNPVKSCSLNAADRTTHNIGGKPGASLAEFAVQHRVFCGGGGGGGHQNDNQGTSGGNGGGIIMIRARVVVGRGGSIRADGRHVSELAGMDGAGGGGAGGTLWLAADTVINVVQMSARGGNGGNVNDSLNYHGPGGGGSGGLIMLTKFHGGLQWDVTGGNQGIHSHPSSIYYTTSNKAEGGAIGTVITTVREKKPLSITLRAWGGGEICAGNAIDLTASEGFVRYQWSNGAEGRVISVGVSGVYSVTATDSNGCAQTVSGLVVKFNPSQFSVDQEIDFGTVDFRVPYIKRAMFKNDDDEDIVLESGTSANGFTIVSPAFPAVIPAGQSLPILVSFFANEERLYEDSLLFTVAKPCSAHVSILVRGRVNPVKALAFMRDTTARVGIQGLELPVWLDILPDSTRLPQTQLVVTLRFDQRLYTVDSILEGSIVGDVIDLVQNHRTMSIEIRNRDLFGGLQKLTGLYGTALLTTQQQSPLEVLHIDWIQARQTPRTSYQPGVLTLEPVCADDLRAVKVIRLSTISIVPNPAASFVSLKTELVANGAYTIAIRTMQGKEVFVHNENHTSPNPRPLEIIIPVSEWAAGTYSVHFATPLEQYSVPLGILP
jgi:hypothetical protein